MVKHFPGRTNNALKEHWRGSMKRKLDSYLASGLLEQVPDLHENLSVPQSSQSEIPKYSKVSSDRIRFSSIVLTRSKFKQKLRELSEEADTSVGETSDFIYAKAFDAHSAKVSESIIAKPQQCATARKKLDLVSSPVKLKSDVPPETVKQHCQEMESEKTVFNGANWSEFAFHMEIHLHMEGQQLWCYLTGERPCPPTLTAPTPPTYAPDAPDAVKKPLLETFEAELEAYQSDLDRQAAWLREEACAKAILFASMEVDISMSLCGLSTSHLMWAHLRRSYEIRNEALYLAVVEEAYSLRQHDSTVEEFHRLDVRRLASSGSLRCGVLC
ncbi:hypothetical protein C2845_PM11G17940 [Panicum miliaceum]|uniref:HTH myb-type domain-containing protein n=1 Tax=Panicum miliaceum TaxID=4540 RepID=A0A3L6RQP1_PANMI|nr:hypothetical protein C2845_PM11G17940 [Panicum miliaceum]